MIEIRTIREIAYAKVNLALHVRNRRSDGYHELDTIFAFVNDGDFLEASHADTLSLTITGPFCSSLPGDSDNLVMQVALLMKNNFNILKGAALHLEKRLPVASGIGGGSADAAAAARLLNRLWGIGATDEVLAALLSRLGADIPACISSQLAKGKGTGTELVQYPTNPFADKAILLVNPLHPVATAEVFAGWDGQDHGALTGSDLDYIVKTGRNDLQSSAIKICPEIELILSSLVSFTPELSRMSGSGATCFALFDNLQNCAAAHAYYRQNYPEYWSMAGTLR